MRIRSVAKSTKSRFSSSGQFWLTASTEAIFYSL